MKRTLAVLSVLLLPGCSEEEGTTSGRQSRDLSEESKAASSEALAAPMYNHPQLSHRAFYGVMEPAERREIDQEIGTPEVVARMHGVQKLTYKELGRLLRDLGVNLTPPAMGANPDSAAVLYTQGMTSLGAPAYAGRVPELVIPSTAALAKQFDIFMAAAPEIIANIDKSKRCPGVKLFESELFTVDGLSCLLGKRATQEHVDLANGLLAAPGPDRATKQKIAVGALLAAAHIGE